VDGDGAIEIDFASPHFYSDGETLDDLVGALTNDVEAHNSFFGTLDDELEGGGLLVVFLDHAEVEGLEGSFVNLYSIPVLLSSLWLGQAYGPHGRVGEDDGSDIVVAELVILEFGRAKQTVGKPSSSSDGDGGQEPLAGNVSDRRYTGNAGVLVLVDDDVALLGGLDANIFQTEVLGIGLATDCPQEEVGLDLVALVGVDGQIPRFTLNLGDLGLSAEFDAGVFHPRSEDFLDGGVESSEDSVTTDEEMGLGSKGVEDTSQFDGDVTSTDDDDTFRLFFEFEETIGGDTKTSSGDFLVRGDGRVTTDGEANLVGLDGVGFLTRLRDPDFGGGKDGSVAVEEVDTLPVPV